MAEPPLAKHGARVSQTIVSSQDGGTIPSQNNAANWTLFRELLGHPQATLAIRQRRERFATVHCRPFDRRLRCAQLDNETVDEVKEQERKLLHMHYEERISGELFDDEQARLRRERHAAEALIERLNLGYQDIADTLDLALEIIGEDLHDLYRQADNTIRRLINQAIFNALYVSDEEITGAELARFRASRGSGRIVRDDRGFRHFRPRVPERSVRESSSCSSCATIRA